MSTSGNPSDIPSHTGLFLTYLKGILHEPDVTPQTLSTEEGRLRIAAEAAKIELVKEQIEAYEAQLDRSK